MASALTPSPDSSRGTTEATRASGQGHWHCHRPAYLLRIGRLTTVGTPKADYTCSVWVRRLLSGCLRFANGRGVEIHIAWLTLSPFSVVLVPLRFAAGERTAARALAYVLIYGRSPSHGIYECPALICTRVEVSLCHLPDSCLPQLLILAFFKNGGRGLGEKKYWSRTPAQR